MAIYLNIGVGPSPIHIQHVQLMESVGNISDWVFVDKYVKEPHILNYDARNIPYDDDSIDAVYSSHLVEHLGMKEVHVVLGEWYRILRKKGKIIINVPDIQWAARELLNQIDGDHPISPVFNTPAKVMEIFFGNQDHEGEFHKSGFTDKILHVCLSDAGFNNIRVKKVYEAHEMGCLIATAIK